MPANRVTLKDIAQQIGLSAATISRALADHPDISGETKQRVREAAQAMSYIPNYRARYLRAKHSRLIALIVPEMNMFFVPSMITGINHVVQQNDYSLIVFQSDNSKYTTITIDDEQAGREAASYLMDRGHTRILGVFGDQRQRISRMRLQGFRRAHAERGLELDESQIIRSTMIEDLDAQLVRAFNEHTDLTAIFAMTDDLLVHTHHFLAQRGTRIPEDVSLMAISDGQAPAFLHPNVTHLRHSGVEVGERTAHLLIGMIEHNSNAMMDVRIRTTLVELGSVADRTRDRSRLTRKRQAR
jgi:LacI family transcriptional regulator